MIRFGADGLRYRSAIQQHRPGDIPRLKLAEILLVAIRHDLPLSVWMVETNGVADLVRDGVSEVIDLQIPVEADLPSLEGIETD